MIDNKSPIWIGVCLIVTWSLQDVHHLSTPAPVQTPAPTTAIPDRTSDHS